MLTLMLLLTMAFPPQAEVCTPIDPATVIWTTQGYSIAIGDGHVLVLHQDVKSTDKVSHVCIPQSHGHLRLYLQRKDWVVQAHGEYAWINDYGYKAADGTHCCGLSDCLEIKQSDIKERPDGFETPHGLVNKRGTYQSMDGKTWVCRRHHAGATPHTSCLFMPGGS